MASDSSSFPYKSLYFNVSPLKATINSSKLLRYTVYPMSKQIIVNDSYLQVVISNPCFMLCYYDGVKSSLHVCVFYISSANSEQLVVQ